MENKEIIFGRNPVLEYIRSLKTADAVLHVSNTAHGRIIDEIISAAKSKRIKIDFCGKDILFKFEPSSRHQGVVLELARTMLEASREITLRDFLAAVGAEKGVLVFLDQITDPHNTGSIIRTTEALGGRGVILTKDRSAGITPAAAKASAGATAHLPVYTVPNAATFLENAKEAGFWIIGTSDKGSVELSKLKELKPAVIIIGSEGTGMRSLTEAKCDFVAGIPLKGNISSLNAAVAAGIILYEALKD
ncbi:MAG: 23S rRNA (guanosine(2251)-2'-O)-methyltransferase RlmB [Spirochaetota bacterium]